MEEWKKVANQLDKDHAKGMLALTRSLTLFLCVSIALSRSLLLYPSRVIQYFLSPVTKVTRWSVSFNHGKIILCVSSSPW